MSMTLAEINQQEQHDADIYASNKAMYEEVLLYTLAMPDGPARREKIAVLLNCYNSMTDSCMRQVSVRRRLEHGHGHPAKDET